MSAELQTLDIFTPDAIAAAGDIYKPVFQNIRIFGTPDAPVFIAKDVQQALDLKDMSYNRDDGPYEWGVDKIKVRVTTRMGPRDMIAFTEQGLYHAIWLSKTAEARQFQKFMTAVMARLRQDGAVSIDTAVQDMQKTIKARDLQLDEEHRTLLHYRYEHDSLVAEQQDLAIELWKAQERLKHAHDPDVELLQEQLMRMRVRYGRPIYILLNEPPRDFRDVYEYDITNYADGDVDIIDPTEVMLFSVSATALKSRVAVKKAYVHKTVKVDDVHAALAAWRLERADGKGPYANIYAISMEQLDATIDTINSADEKKHQE